MHNIKIKEKVHHPRQASGISSSPSTGNGVRNFQIPKIGNGIFGQKVLKTVCWHYLINKVKYVLIKCKRLQNRKGNGLCRPKTKAK
jgi:hypothetical protein